VLNSFSEEDKAKFIQYLNMVSKFAVFNNMKNEDIIQYFKLLNYMQISFLPKIEKNIFEVKKVIEPINTESTEMDE